MHEVCVMSRLCANVRAASGEERCVFLSRAIDFPGVFTIKRDVMRAYPGMVYRLLEWNLIAQVSSVLGLAYPR